MNTYFQKDNFVLYNGDSIRLMENLPENSKIKYWFSNKSFDRFLNINLDLCRLLGTYTAEGHCRENKTTRQVSFRICHPILGNDTYDRIKRVFNIISALEENNTKITISHSLVYYLFKYIPNFIGPGVPLVNTGKSVRGRSQTTKSEALDFFR